MSQVGLETLAEYGRQLGIEPPKEEIQEKAFLIYNNRRYWGITGTPESDWRLAEKALYANLWVDHVIQVVPGSSKLIGQQITKLAKAILKQQDHRYDSPKNWVLASEMIGQRTDTGKIIVSRKLLSL